MQYCSIINIIVNNSSCLQLLKSCNHHLVKNTVNNYDLTAVLLLKIIFYLH